jgi:peptide/nickel transport system permease protein
MLSSEVIGDDPSPAGGPPRRSVRSTLRQLPLLPIAIIALLLVMALAAPLLSPFPPTEQNLVARLRPPFWIAGGSMANPLGTDLLGRDVLSRMLYGARVSLSVALIAIIVAGAVGTAVGLVAGYFGGLAETILMRTVDAFLAVPAVLVAVVLASVLDPSFENVIIVIGLLYWPRYARQVRAETLSIKARDHVLLAVIAGCSSARIIATHVLPNLLPSLLVLASLQVGSAIILEATLSFLGVGIPPPQPAWGVIVEDGRGMLASAWWIALFPGIAIAVTVLAFNLAGDWLRDHLDPKLRAS